MKIKTFVFGVILFCLITGCKRKEKINTQTISNTIGSRISTQGYSNEYYSLSKHSERIELIQEYVAIAKENHLSVIFFKSKKVGSRVAFAIADSSGKYINIYFIDRSANNLIYDDSIDNYEIVELSEWGL